MKHEQIQREEYVGTLMSRRLNGFVKVITGIRRCGKSYLLQTLFKKRLMEDGVKKDHIVEVDLDDKKFFALRDPLKLDDYVRGKVKGTRRSRGTFYVFIDEIQRSRKVPSPGVDLATVLSDLGRDASRGVDG